MCLYPRLIRNPKYKRNKKNGGIIPAVSDKRVQWVPIGCNVCIECRKQKVMNWTVRLNEDIKDHTNGKFVTLTFSTESLVNLLSVIPNADKLKGYEIDNAICTKAVRLFLERWRKKFKKSLRHWFVSEIGGGHSEHVHLHGIVWCDDVKILPSIWQYGFVWYGYEVNGIIENYVNSKTVNYITKYVNKIDELHPNYMPVILCSPGIGSYYYKSGHIQRNKFYHDKTIEYYRTDSGHKISLPIYYRNHVYSEWEREKLWLYKLDKNTRFVCGDKVKADSKDYDDLLRYHQDRTIQLGYPTPEFLWKRKKYEEERRNMLYNERLSILKNDS